MEGKNDPSNYLSACKNCNRKKGSMPPQDWCKNTPRVMSYDYYVNYLLNRAHTFATDRDHVQAGWRFASVMAVGFSLTGLFMWIFAEKLEIPYLIARVITTGIVFCWNFAAHKMWTFGERRPE